MGYKSFPEPWQGLVLKKEIDMKADFEQKSTDDLLELLPSNLHLARNENAAAHDRWRIYNAFTQKYTEPGADTARNILVFVLSKIESQMAEWTGRD